MDIEAAAAAGGQDDDDEGSMAGGGAGGVAGGGAGGEATVIGGRAAPPCDGLTSHGENDPHAHTHLKANKYGLYGSDDGLRHLAIDDSIYCLTFFCLIDKIRIGFNLSREVENYFFKSTMIFFI